MKRYAILSLTTLALASAAQAQSAQFAAAGTTQAPAFSRWAPAQPGGYSVNNYQYDDGVSENAIGVTTTGTPSTGLICWLTRYDAVAGADTITSVSVAYGSLIAPGAPANGSPSNVGVWEDPNNDGNPIDAVLLTQQATTVQNADTDILNMVPVTPVNVSGVFFVGAFCPTMWSTPALSDFPASLDTTSQSLGRSWILAHTPSTGFNPANLAGPYSINLIETSLIGPAFDGVWLLRAEGGSTTPTTYCTPKTTSNGCNPSIGSSGVSSATAAAGFVINGTDFINNKNCLLFYGVNGQAAGTFQGGTLCVKTPIKRTPATNTFGNPPPNDCSGIPALDFNTFTQGGLGGSPLLPALQTPGTVVNSQWWGRDPGFTAPNNTQLSNGIEFTVGP